MPTCTIDSTRAERRRQENEAETGERGGLPCVRLELLLQRHPRTSSPLGGELPLGPLCVGPSILEPVHHTIART